MEEIEEPRMTSSFFFFFLSTENGRMELPLPLNEIKKGCRGNRFWDKESSFGSVELEMLHILVKIWRRQLPIWGERFALEICIWESSVYKK